MTMPRVVAREVLDHLAAADPAAQRSRRDLRRVHRAMGTRSIVASGWQSLWPSRRVTGPLKILEIGAGDGTLLLAVARTLAPAWPDVHLTLLDHQDIVSPATRAAYAELGWTTSVDVADVLDWAADRSAASATTSSAASAPRPCAPSWDLITTTLFLHHFDGPQLDALLVAIASRSHRFFACEPRRAWPALAGSHLVGAIGANEVTRTDAVSSVRAGFRARELSERWPGTGRAWHAQEYAAGLFSHCFGARRSEAEA